MLLAACCLVGTQNLHTVHATELTFISLFSRQIRNMDDRIRDLEREIELLPVASGASSSVSLGWHTRSLPSAEVIVRATIDLGSNYVIDKIALVPSSGENEGYLTPGYGFPLRFQVELSETANFDQAIPVGDFSKSDIPNPGSFPFVIQLNKQRGRYVRFTSRKAWPRYDDWIVVLGEIMVISGERNVAAGASVSASSSVRAQPIWSPAFLTDGQSLLGPPVNREPSPSNGYLAVQESSPDILKWVQVDLGREFPIDDIRLFPSRPTDFADAPGIGFPPRLRIEVDNNANFTSPRLIFATGSEEMGNPGDNPVTIVANRLPARWLRVTATRLRVRGSLSSFSLAELQVWSDGINVAKGVPVSALDVFSKPNYPRWRPEYLVDGFNSRHQIIDLPVWLDGLARRQEIVRELEMIRTQRSQVTDALLARTLKLSVTLVLAAITLGTFAFWRSRLSRRREMERLRLRIASDLHDELGSQLSSIAIAAQLALRRVEDGEATRQRIEEIERIAWETNESMHDIVWLLEPGNLSLQELVLRMRESAAKLLRDTRYAFHCHESVPSRSLSIDFTRNMLLLFKEILQNIVKHAQAKTVTIEITIQRDEFQFEVHDDGLGFDLIQTPRGNGLDSMHHRADQMRGNFIIDSSPANGTTVRIEAPIR